MVKEKVGRNDWKQLKVGETGVYTLPDERAVEGMVQWYVSKPQI